MKKQLKASIQKEINIGDCLLITLDKENKAVKYSKISKNRLEEIKKADRELFKLNYHLRRSTELVLNLKDFNDSLSKHLKQLINKTSYDYGELILIDTNRIFNNILSSFKVFVDHFEGRIKRNYGKESNEFNKTKKILKNAYDSFFEYKLIYELRNFSQHNSYVIDKVNFGKGKVIGNLILEPMINKHKLLLDTRLKKKIGTELKMYNDFIPVDYILYKLRNIIEGITDELLLIEIESKWQHITILKEIIAQLPNSYNIGFCEIENETLKTMSFNIHLIQKSITMTLFNFKKASNKRS